MRPVEIYTTPSCGFCVLAKRLLERKGVSFAEIDVVRAPERRQEMVQRTKGRRSVPQIFVGETHVGGYEDLSALERAGRLDALIAG